MAPRSGFWIGFLAGALAALWPGSTVAQQAKPSIDEPVDVELVLAVDVSSSMMADELALQRKGYAAAFRSSDVVRTIGYGRHRRVAVTYFEWGASNRRETIVPWTRVSSAADAAGVADILEAAKTRNLSRTSISGAIRHAAGLFDGNGYAGLRRVIDVSGDGPNNEGGLVSDSRDAAIRQGITINGLPVVIEGRAFGEENIAFLDDYYADCVVGGPQSFLMPVRHWDQFAEAVRWKLIVELSGERPRVWPAAASLQGDKSATIDCGIGEQSWREMERD